ncbi:hypothetical protein GA0061093_13437, partial [Rhodococcus qingshengii]
IVALGPDGVPSFSLLQRRMHVLRLASMLPWDEWGRMTDAYDGKTDADYGCTP